MTARSSAHRARHHTGPLEALLPYRLLALRVITLAVRDLSEGGHSRSERSSARAFLAGSHMLTHWCRLADLDPAAFGEQVRDLLDRPRHHDHAAGRH